MIPLFQPSIGEREVEYVTEVLLGKWLGTGPKVGLLEKKLAEYTNASYVVGVNSGTAALHLALKVLDVRPNDEVIVPTISFVSTAHAVKYVGARVIFADVIPDRLSIDIKDVERKISKRTKAVIVMHYGGHPVDMDEFVDLCESQNITLLEDAAHAFGASYKKEKIGSLTDLTCFSHHAVKNLSTGLGGSITTFNRSTEQKLKQLRWCGISKDTWSRSARPENVYAWSYKIPDLGYQYSLSDINAAIGLAQLERIDQMQADRRRLVTIYNEAFKDLNWLELPKEESWAESSWHLYYVKLERRNELIAHLKEHDIASGVHYFPLHRHDYYQNILNRNPYCPVSERQWRRVLSLPLFPDMSELEQEQVISAIRSFGA